MEGYLEALESDAGLARGTNGGEVVDLAISRA